LEVSVESRLSQSPAALCPAGDEACSGSHPDCAWLPQGVWRISSSHGHGGLAGIAFLSTGTEFFGGIAIVLGLFTRFFSLAFVIEMAVAIWKVHFKNGLTGQGGYEFPLALATIAFALAGFSGGPWGLRFGGGSAARKSK
jgi:uncharacterized membrane protein YphA (DoxX/SURF4 family)